MHSILSVAAADARNPFGAVGRLSLSLSLCVSRFTDTAAAAAFHQNCERVFRAFALGSRASAAGNSNLHAMSDEYLRQRIKNHARPAAPKKKQHSTQQQVALAAACKPNPLFARPHKPHTGPKQHTKEASSSARVKPHLSGAARRHAPHLNRSAASTTTRTLGAYTSAHANRGQTRSYTNAARRSLERLFMVPTHTRTRIIRTRADATAAACRPPRRAYLYLHRPLRVTSYHRSVRRRRICNTAVCIQVRIHNARASSSCK